MGCSSSHSVDDNVKRNDNVENKGEEKSKIDKASIPPDSPKTAKAKRTKDSLVSKQKGASGKGKGSNNPVNLNSDAYLCVSQEDLERLKEECNSKSTPLFTYCGTDDCGNCSYFYDEFKETMESNGFSWLKVSIMESPEVSFEDCPQGQMLMMPFIKCYNNSTLVGATFGADSHELKDLISKLDCCKETVKKPKMIKKEVVSQVPGMNNDNYNVVSNKEFENAKDFCATNSKALVAFFGREGCGLCKMMYPIVKKTCSENDKYNWIKVDIDQCNNLAWEDMDTSKGSLKLPFIRVYEERLLVGTMNGYDIDQWQNLVNMTNEALLTDNSNTGSKKSNMNSNNNTSSNQKFIDESLERHNYYRALHGASDLTHNSELTKKAQKYAEYLASKDLFEHSNCKWGNKDVGENLAMCGGCPMTGQKSVDMWYDELYDPGYNYDNPGFDMGTGHFTQVVWVGSKEVGFGLAQSQKTKRWYSVANYYPPGNYEGQFEENVLPASEG